MTKIIEVNQLAKSFGKVQAIKNINFYVEEGTLFAFLGTNGAGKSTAISILLTLLKQNKGEVKIKGYTVGKDDTCIRQEIGVVFQESLLDPLLTVKENLEIRAALYHKSKTNSKKAVESVTSRIHLHDFLNRPYGKLSGGERRRADIARALLHQPSILILDEPTTGLDSESRKSLWATITMLQKETNMTVFLTTHYIEEAANSDYVVVMDKGEIIGRGTPEQLKSDFSSDTLIITAIDSQVFKDILKQDFIPFKYEKTSFIFDLKDTKSALPILYKYEQYIASFEVQKSSLDDVFIKMTRR